MSSLYFSAAEVLPCFQGQAVCCFNQSLPRVSYLTPIADETLDSHHSFHPGEI